MNNKKRFLAIIIPLGFLLGPFLIAFIIDTPMPFSNAGVRRLEQQTLQHQIEIEILSIGEQSISYRIINNNPNQFIVYTNHRDFNVPTIYKRQGFIWIPVSYTPMVHTPLWYGNTIRPNSYIDTSYSGWVLDDEEAEYLIILNVLVSDSPLDFNEISSNQGDRIRIATRFTIPYQ